MISCRFTFQKCNGRATDGDQISLLLANECNGGISEDCTLKRQGAAPSATQRDKSVAPWPKRKRRATGYRHWPTVVFSLSPLIVPTFLFWAKPKELESSVTRSTNHKRDELKTKHFINNFLGLGKTTDGKTPERVSRSGLPAVTGNYTTEMRRPFFCLHSSWSTFSFAVRPAVRSIRAIRVTCRVWR
jgi:hypothetical protein